MLGMAEYTHHSGEESRLTGSCGVGLEVLGQLHRMGADCQTGRGRVGTGQRMEPEQS